MPESSIQQPPPIMIPTVVRDLAGREVTVEAPLGAFEIITPIGNLPIGCFRFVPTGEKAPLTGYPIYVQESQRPKTPAVIDAKTERVE